MGNRASNLQKKVVKRDKTQVWTARIALIILLVIVFGSAISSLIDYIFSKKAQKAFLHSVP